MSWTEVFPVLTDDHVDSFERSIDSETLNIYNSWFTISEIINQHPNPSHIVSTSIFWKNTSIHQPFIHIEDRRSFMQPAKSEVLRFDPWRHYVAPLLKGAYELRGSGRKDIVLRVYLAADLDFLIPDLIAAGCEIFLMKSSGIAHNPGAMWRFLALEEEGPRLVTILDADRAHAPWPDVLRSTQLNQAGLGWWRVPVWGELNDKGEMNYRPFLGCQFGSNQTLPVRSLMMALIWHTEHKTIDIFCRPPGCVPVRIYGSAWPDYGYDEWFLQTAIYPRAVSAGILTFIPNTARSRFLPLDIEYVQWANAASQIILFGRDENSRAENLRNRQPFGAPIHSDLECGQIPASHLTQQHRLPKHTARSGLIPGSASGTDTGTVVAWCNPGLTVWKGKYWLAYRTECLPLFKWSRVSLAWLDSDLNPVEGTNQVLNLPTSFNKWGAEDPRLFVFQNRLFLTYTDGWVMGMAELDGNGKVIRSRLLNPVAGSSRDPFKRKSVCAMRRDPALREKNWSLFASENKLHVIYWICPQIIFEIDPETWKLSNPVRTNWMAPCGGEIHSTSNGIAHHDMIWQLVHSTEPLGGGRRRYHCWLRAFEARPPFRPRLLSAVPLLSGHPAGDNLLPPCDHEVIFASVLEREELGWLVIFGQNDRRILHTRFTDAELDGKMVEVS